MKFKHPLILMSHLECVTNVVLRELNLTMFCGVENKLVMKFSRMLIMHKLCMYIICIMQDVRKADFVLMLMFAKQDRCLVFNTRL